MKSREGEEMFSFRKDKLKNIETENINEIDLETTEEKHLFKILNIILIVIVVIATIISMDTVCVSKYQKGPFFAIRTKVYKDGGTKVYYGLGYKVIKYHQEVGRRDIAVGLWTMPYNTKPTAISILDLAIELGNHPKESFKKYQKQFLKIEGEVYKVNNKKKELTLRFLDEDKKYSLDITCSMAEVNKEIIEGDHIEVIGTVSSYTLGDNKKDNSISKLGLENCFAK